MALSNGEKWIRLLRAYGPVADNEGQQAEHVGRLASSLGVSQIAFTHPARAELLSCFPSGIGEFRNVVLTGTAGEGKTSLCFELVQALTGRPPAGNQGVETLSLKTPGGPRTITLIYDVTAWRKKSNGYLLPDHVALLARMADSSFGASDDFFVLAVNDGQMHELFRALPSDAPESVRKLEHTLINLHARGEKDGSERLRLINLSAIASEEIMALCLDAVLDRPEWSCLETEGDNPLFSAASSLTRNYRAIVHPETRAKLVMLARLADVTGHHLPTRGVLCLLSNALLGHPRARDRVIRPGVEAAAIVAQGNPQDAALHCTLFGENLSVNARRKREVYRFLSALHIGDETTSDLDELLIFGTRDPELATSYQELVAPDPFMQRHPNFDDVLRRYIRGDINSADDTDAFLAELAAERRRVFLQASPAQMEKFRLWRTSIFHHAREYQDEVLQQLNEGRIPPRLHLRKLATGLNRIWTGLLLAENASEVYLATGLDLTTSAISDLYLAQLDLDGDPPGLSIVRPAGQRTPILVLRLKTAESSFALTLPRFEFLCRVADGAMPSSFSREACADFMSLKQRCLRDLGLKASTRSLQLIEVHGAGTIQRRPIHLTS